MSAEAGGAGGAGGAGAPSEEELRAAYEAELSRVNVTDLVAQSTVTLLNLAARRLGPPPAPDASAPEGEAPAGGPTGGRDLEQVRDAIDAARALLEILERRIPREARPLRDALSQLQMAYAAEVRAGAAEESSASAAPAAKEAEAPAAPAGAGEPARKPGDDGEQGEEGHRPGPAESSGRLWVPGQ